MTWCLHFTWPGDGRGCPGGVQGCAGVPLCWPLYPLAPLRPAAGDCLWLVVESWAHAERGCSYLDTWATSRVIDAWIVAGLDMDTHHTPTISLHQAFKHWQVCKLRRHRQSDRDIILFEICSNLIWKSILVRDFQPAMRRSHKYHNSYNVRIEPLPLNNWEAKTFKIHNIKAKHDTQLVLSHI